MPKISVNEQDLSWFYRQRTSGAIIVYIPGVATFGPNDEPTLVNKDTFSRYFGIAPVDDPKDRSYLTAASFVNSGFDVLFHRVVPEAASVASASLMEGVTLKAKYEGTYGNTFKIKAQKALDGDNTVIYVYAYDANMTLLERATFNLFDTTDSNYYDITNNSTKFIEIELTEGTTAASLRDATITGADEKTGLISLTGGSDGTAGSIVSDAVTEVSAAGFFDKLLDPYQYWFDAIIDGGLNDLEKSEGDVPYTASKVDTALSELATKRGAALYFVDGLPEMTAEQYYNYCESFNTSYACAFGPWGYAQYTATGTTALLPGSYAMIVRWAQSVSDGNPAWMAPAGVKRAQLGSFYKGTKYVVDKTTLDDWQNHEYIEQGQYKVNPIMKLKQYGYCVYGNSTLLHNGADGATSMLQSFSVRVLSNMIKSHAFDVSLNLQFDQITDDLFAQFKTLMGVFMDQLKYQGALYDYNLIVDRSTMTDADLNSKTVPVRIQISPNPAAENFTINLEISQAGVSFADDTDETEIA